MNTTPLVSVVILSYDQESFVEQTIKCVLDQKTDFYFEIIIGDDYSTDNTRNIIDKYKKDFPDQIITHYPDKNTGLLLNIDACIKICRGKFLAICAGDDYWHDPFKLQKQVDFLNQHSVYGVVHSDADYLYFNSGKSINSYRKTNNTAIPSGLIFERLLLDNFILAPTVCMELDLVRKYIDFEEFKYLGFLMEDYPMWLELSNRTNIGFLDESLATYRIHKKSIRNTDSAQKLLNFLNSTYKIKNHYINKFGCSQETKNKVEERYYKKLLFYSTILKNPSQSKTAYDWLQSHSEKIRVIEYLYYYTTIIKPLRSISSFLLKRFHSLK